MSIYKNLRKRSFIDPAVQRGLVVRIVSYWAVCTVDVAVILIFWRIGTSAANGFDPRLGEMWSDYGPVLLATLLLLPLALIDIIRFSHRFVGPILRLRRSMQQLGRGEDVKPIKFRNGDFWQDLADEFNAVLARVQRQAAAEATTFSPDDRQMPDGGPCSARDECCVGSG